MSYLSVIPQEILLHIIDQLRGFKSLLLFACTSQYISSVTLPYMYALDVKLHKSTALLQSVQNDHQDVVQRLLRDYRADVNTADQWLQTPIFYAILMGNFKSLCKSSCEIDFNWQNCRGQTALMFSISKRAPSILQFLQSQGNKLDLELMDAKKRTALWYAVHFQQPEIVQKLLDLGSRVDHVDCGGKGPIHGAISARSIPMLRSLIKHNVPGDNPSPSQIPPLCAAVSIGFEEGVSILLHCGVNINERDRDGRTPLMLAIIAGNGSICVQLLKESEINIDATDTDQKTALHLAFSYYWPIIPFLLDRSNINTEDSGGSSPLWLAMKYGLKSIVHKIMESSQSQANLNVRAGDEKCTILHIAVRRCEHEFVSFLLRRKDLDPNICDTKGCTALYYAAYWDDVRMVDILLSRSDVSSNGLPPLWVATRRGNIGTVCRILFCPRIDINMGHLGRTPLLEALHQNNQDIARLLIRRKDVDINAVTDDEDTPLALASEIGSIDLIEMITHHSALEVSRLLKEKIMCQAERSGNHDVVRFLVHSQRLSPHRRPSSKKRR